MTGVDGASERLRLSADVVTREALTLTQTDSRLFSAEFGLAQVASLSGNPDLAERVDAFVARFSRLQDTLGAALVPRLLEASLEPVGTVLDNLNRAERDKVLTQSAGGSRGACLRPCKGGRSAHTPSIDAAKEVAALRETNDAPRM